MVAVCRAKAERAEYVAPAATSSERKKKHRTTNGETRETSSRKVANGGPGVAGGPSVIRRRVLVDARVCDAAIAPFESESFDAVVDTFGLCSFEDPVAALREMSRVCRGKKKKKKNAGAGAGSGDAPGSGKIYLLEHGRSDWDWVSNILDKHADPHAKRWGCYWNRDILAIVREAGLEIESVARYHLGTTYVIVAAPPSEA
jgi:SAM-dependent methyltransferase